MEEVKKTKKELIVEAQQLADKLQEKKDIIKTAIDNLDEKAKKGNISSEHLEGMAVIEQLFSEYDELELEQLKILEKIKEK